MGIPGNEGRFGGDEDRISVFEEDLEHLHRMAISAGVEAMSLHVIEPLTLVLDEPERAFEILGVARSDIEEEINERVQGMIESL